MVVDLWIWSAFAAAVAVLLLLDLLVVHRDAHAVTVPEAGILTAVWLLLRVAFAGVLWCWQTAAAGTAA